MSFAGISLAANAGALTFTSLGEGGAKSITVGASGVVNSSVNNTLTFDITSKVNIVLSANASFTANGSIAILDDTNHTSGFDIKGFTLTLNGTSPDSHIEKGFIDTVGGGKVVKSGSGTWTIAGVNSYTGNTTLSDGTLSVSSLAAGGTASNIGQSSNAAANLVFDGGTLQYTGAAVSTDRLFTLTANGGAIDASGAGTLTFAAAGSIAFSGLNTSPTLTLTGTNTGTNTLSAVLGNNDGATSLTKTGVGTWVLTGANTLSGNVTVSAGTLTVNSNSGASLASSAAFLVVNGGTLNLNNPAQTIASLSGGTGGTINLGTNHTLTDNQVTPASFAGTLAGPGNLVKSGPGTLTLSGANIYTGTTLISGGSLSVNTLANVGGGASALGAPTTVAAGTIALGSTTIPGALLYTGAAVSTNRVINLAGTTGGATLDASGTGALTFTSALTATGIGAKTLTLSGTSIAANTLVGAIPDSASGATFLTKSGVGTWVLSGANTYTGGTMLNAGTLAVAANSNLGAANGGVMFTGGALQATASFTAARATTLGAGGGMFDVPSSGVTLTWDGNIGGTGALTLNGSGTLVLGAANNFTGPVVLMQGTLKLGAAGALPSGAPINLGSGATLDLNGHDATLGSLAGGGNLTNGGANLTVAQSGYTLFSGVISGAGGLTKSDVGQLILTGIQDFTGPTTISAGDLKINGSATRSIFTVNNGGTLSGNGTVGPLTVVIGGTLAPGSSPGRLTVSGDLTLAGITAMELSGTARGTGGYDAVDVSGAITFGGTLTLSLINGFNPLSGQSFNLFDWTGTRSGTFDAVNLPSLAGGLTWDADALYTSGALSITASAIPEPSAYAVFAGAALLGFAAWRRRRARTQVAHR